jgi:hypothetical protein
MPRPWPSAVTGPANFAIMAVPDHGESADLHYRIERNGVSTAIFLIAPICRTVQAARARDVLFPPEADIGIALQRQRAGTGCVSAPLANGLKRTPPTPYPLPDEAIHVGKDFKIAPSSIICHVLHEPCPIGAVVLLEHRPDVAASTARILGVSGHARRFGFHIYTGHSHKEIE